MRIDFKRNNRIALRNFSENCDFHDIVKLLIVKQLRRTLKRSDRCPIYTEHDPERPQEFYPDIWACTDKGEIYVWELQDKLTNGWRERIVQQYEDVNLIIVDLQKVKKELKKVLVDKDGFCDWITELKTILQAENAFL